jgi:hypothetical protein
LALSLREGTTSAGIEADVHCVSVGETVGVPKFAGCQLVRLRRNKDLADGSRLLKGGVGIILEGRADRSYTVRFLDVRHLHHATEEELEPAN